ncbi:MAG: PQQ-binding-like beta-propeller repeat protein [Pseudohongiellaceae bacterium]
MFSQNKRFIAAATLVLLVAGGQSVRAAESAGADLYEQYCATCHADPDDVRTPNREALGSYNANSIHHALTDGVMQAQAAALSEEQVIVLSEYLSGGEYNASPMQDIAMCSSSMPPLDVSAAANWSAWGNDAGNSRHQSAEGTRINAGNLDQLELAWAFGVEGANAVRAQPVVISGTMFMGSPSGTVYAMDLESGCAYWTFPAITGVRAAIPVVYSEALDRHLAVVADGSNRLYVLDARDGERLWWDDVDDNPWARSTGSPVVHGNRIFVPVSSGEVSGAARPDHHCCTFRGNVAVYDLNSGSKLWHTWVMEEARQVGENPLGNPVLAPSGAPIWQAPSIDPSRDVVYAGTGQNYSRPTSDTSDAVIAFDIHTGAMRWVYQTMSDDAFHMGCTMSDNHPNCPDPGPDVDIGAPILPVTLSDGREIVVAGTKGGVVFGLDPDRKGDVLWETRVGRGSALGGIHWGMTHMGDVLFVPVADRAIAEGDFPRQPGLHAIDMKTGESLWYTPAPERCGEDQRGCFDQYSAPSSSGPDFVMSGSLSGHLFAHDPETGEVIWEYDSNRQYETINGVAAQGGAFDATGPVFSGDYMIVNAGYGGFGQLPGNAVLVFRLPQD